MTQNGNGYNGRYTAKEVADALTDTRGFVTHAARRLGCHRMTVLRYMKRFPTVQKARDDAKEALIDHAEIKLIEAINSGNMTAIIFFLKTQGKDRGYVQRHEVKDVTQEPVAKLSDEDILTEAQEIINIRETDAS